MAGRATDTGAGVVAANGGAPRHAAPEGVGPFLTPGATVTATAEKARDPGDGAPREARLVPGLLRVPLPAQDAKTVEARPRVACAPARHLDETDGAEVVQGPAAAVQVAGGQAQEADDEARAEPATVVVAPRPCPLVAARARLRRVTGEGRVVADTGLKEAAGHDPVDQATAEAVAAGGVPVVLKEGGGRLGLVGPR